MICRAELVGVCYCAPCARMRYVGKQAGEYWSNRLQQLQLESLHEYFAPEETQMSNPTYDVKKCKRETLEILAHRTLEAYIAAPGSLVGQSIQKVKEEARVKTQAEYDAEIGELLRKHLSEHGGMEPQHWTKLKELAAESRSAKVTPAF